LEGRVLRDPPFSRLTLDFFLGEYLQLGTPLKSGTSDALDLRRGRGGAGVERRGGKRRARCGCAARSGSRCLAGGASAACPSGRQQRFFGRRGGYTSRVVDGSLGGAEAADPMG